MMKKWMGKYLQQLFLSAVLFITFAVLAGKSEYFSVQKNMRSMLEAASYRTVLAVDVTFVISSGIMDPSAGPIASLCGALTASTFHGGMGIWAFILTGTAAGDLMGALSGVLIHYTGINLFVLIPASSGVLRGISLTITDGRSITKFGREFVQLGTDHTEEFQVPAFFTLALVLLSFPLMLHVKWGNYVRTLNGSESVPKWSEVRTGLHRISVHMFLGIMVAVTAVIITARLNSVKPDAGVNMELDATTVVIMGDTPVCGGNASTAGTILATLILGSTRNRLTLLSASSDFQQWITGFLPLASILISEIRVWNTKALTK